jgi:light-regulated signal transduction histidine kinase (bacteriophytochrome)
MQTNEPKITIISASQMEKTPLLKETEQMEANGNLMAAYDKEYVEFADLAVHDLDAPLRKLSVLVGMLTGKISADKDMQSYIERIGHCIGDMRSLIDDFSTWARLEQDKKQFTPCVIEEVVQQALENMPPSIKIKQAIITTLSLPIIEGNADQFTILFTVLLENAIKYSKKEMVPEIQIQSFILSSAEKQYWNLSEDRVYYKIEMSDNGIGFKNEHAEKIFRPLVRLHGKSQFPGTGIGLAMCRRIIEIHDGIISAEGRENEGSKFVLILPESH